MITAEQSDDVSGDVAEVTSSLDDRYYLNGVDLRFRRVGEDGATDVQVSFGNALIIADDGASILDLTRTAVEVLNPVLIPANDMPKALREVLKPNRTPRTEPER